MLTPDELKSFRERFEKAERRPMTGPRVWCMCLGGPLDGLRARVEAATVNNPEAVWCFGTVIRTGCVVAMYEHSDKPNEWRFRGWDEPSSGSKEALESGLRSGSVGKQKTARGVVADGR
jgi:hypothetical protein